MFLAKIDIIDDDAGGDRRNGRDERVPVMKPSTARGEDRVPLDIEVENLSRRGARFRSEREFAIGSRVSIGLSGVGAHPGKIVWRANQLYGCVFAEALSADTLQEAFRSADVVVGSIGEPSRSMPDPEDFAKWPRRARLLILISGAVGSWLAVFALARMAIG